MLETALFAVLLLQAPSITQGTAQAYCVDTGATFLSAKSMLKSLRSLDELRATRFHDRCQAEDLVIQIGHLQKPERWVLRVHRLNQDEALFRNEVAALTEARARQKLARAFSRWLGYFPRKSAQATPKEVWKLEQIADTGDKKPKVYRAGMESDGFRLAEEDSPDLRILYSELLDADVNHGEAQRISSEELVPDGDPRGAVITVPLAVTRALLLGMVPKARGTYLEILWHDSEGDHYALFRIVSGSSSKLAAALKDVVP